MKWNRTRSIGLLVSTGVLMSAVACSGLDFGASEGDSTYYDEGENAQGDAKIEEPPSDPNAPEQEEEETFRTPVVSGEYLWSANPETGKIARVNASTLEIEVFEAGNTPTYLASLPEGATHGGALVINALSENVSIFRFAGEGAEMMPKVTLPVQAGASAWAVGRSGKVAIAWSRSSEDLKNDLDGYQDLTIYRFNGDDVEAHELSVGYRPTRIFINDKEDRAYIVSEPGISVVDLKEPVSILREIFLPPQTIEQPRDVEVTRDGKFALVRIGGESDLLIINTETREEMQVSLPGPVTDLDLSGDGSTAIAVVRSGQPSSGAAGGGGLPGILSESVIAFFSLDTLPEGRVDMTQIRTSEIVGSAVISETGSHAMLFTNAISSQRLVLLDVEDESTRVLDLKAPLRSSFISKGAEFGVALMDPPFGSTKKGAFALVPVDKSLPARIEGTETVPKFVSLASDASRALITTERLGETRAKAYFAKFPGLSLDEVSLPSAPLSSGVVPEAEVAFVAQEHSEGRVTFIGLEEGDENTVTGFELADKVVD